MAQRKSCDPSQESRPVCDSELPRSERARLQELELRVRELEQENLFLSRSVAYFAKKRR
ncbi:hypothetical protein [Nocardia sp. NBC_01327]|uniref:hypothetical protein n=1 Tax=Nocardia sp. NBC_01327 TaxID=2903593 RepID=UPI002E106F16|nr:hypothetical protein OG326_16120 [Nocardia sp. NBC_01327]